MSSRYDALVTIATLMCITSCTFFLGILYSNWPYTHAILWVNDYQNNEISTKLLLNHYLHWLEVPKFIPYTMYGVVCFGFLGFTIKIFRPAVDIQYFEYGSFIVYILAVCCYVSNIRFGIYSAQAGEWGDVDEYTGLSVIAASEVINVFLLLGIVVIQSGLFYAKYEDDRVKTTFLMNELKSKLAQAESNIINREDSNKTKSKGKSSGVSKKVQ